MKGRLLIFNVDFSGIDKFIFKYLEKAGWKLTIYNLPKYYKIKIWAIISTFSPNINKWISKAEHKYNQLHKTPEIFIKRTKWCEKIIKNETNDFKAILQISGTFMPVENLDELSIPYFILTDYTMKLAERAYLGQVPLGKDLDKWYELESRLYRRAENIFIPAEYISKSLTSDYGVGTDKIIDIGYGCKFDDLMDIKKDYSNNTILFIGKEFVRKGGNEVVQAFIKVKEKIPDAILQLVGPRTNPNKEIKGVTFLGRIKNRIKMLKLFKDASLFVIHPYSEPFGLVFLEAMATKTPCIGTNIDAMPDILEASNAGFVVPIGDIDALAEMMIFILTNKKIAKQMGDAGYKKVCEVYNWEKVVKRIDNCLSKILK